MLLGKYHITDHAIEQYSLRFDMRSKKDIVCSIRRDLKTLNIKNIVYKEELIHVFTRGYKEFIFVKNKGELYLKTVIKRNHEDTVRTIYKRKNKPCYS